ncbi:metal ABC transporter permease [Gleimia sp. 6138-11-ORH1]|uniref:metal ABC transporter permease n=1 Tax=Gleimia sp. 6138-11-ORH1 TaxID=2973937 RepID=UPI00216835F2|nr:metal ABC transporter permease [Gleimia sp. 6138-11-ORH1]MCS4485070.1 metal ABC transporter permease [Gleimia sp. 6138-11-ORH1]
MTAFFLNWIVTLDGAISLSEFLTNYTFRTMLIGTTLIGLTSGALGCFLYLRKQSLISDVIGHSAIAGVMLAFIIAAGILNIEGRSMLVLTIGAVISATIAVLISNWVTQDSRVSIDAAMAISLSLFYGIGMVLMRQITRSSLQGRGGIDKYMFGNAATLLESDLYTIGFFGGLALLIMLIFWKEFKVFTFDPVLATQMGFNPRILNPLMMGAVTIAIVIGVKAVGLILMIAFAIMPAAAARQWTKRLSSMVLLSALIGGFSGAVGSYLSANLGRVPTGPIVVIILFTIFLVSLTFAPERSVLRRLVMRRAKAKELEAIVRGELSYEDARALNNQPEFRNQKTMGR